MMSNLSSAIFYLSSFTILSFIQKYEKKKIGLASFVVLICCFLMAGLRYNVGSDYMNYFYIYQNVCEMTFSEWLQSFDFGSIPLVFFLTAKLGNVFGSDWFYFGLLGMLTVLPFVLLLNSRVNKKDRFLLCLFFLTNSFLTSFNTTKQQLAISFIIFGLQFVYDRSFVKYALCVLVAFCCHPTAIIAFPVYWFYSQNTTTFTLKKVVIILAVIFAMIYVNQILTSLGGRFEDYTAYEEKISNKSFYINIVWLVVILLLRSRLVALDGRNELLVFLYFLGILLGLTGFVSPVIKRIAEYFLFAFPFLLVQLPLVFRKQDRWIISLAIFLYIVGMCVWTKVILEQSEVVPYVFRTRF